MNLNKMDIVNFLIKPVSSNCNLNCKYCFYLDIASDKTGFMSIATLENLIKEAFRVANKGVVFAFQGGEPTLAGLPFFKRFIELVKLYNINKINVSYSIQTNGILLDDVFCTFLKQNNFLVGISLDGYKELHDENRYDYHHKSTFVRVMKSIDLLKKHQVDFNVLTVVHSKNYKFIEKIYQFFRQNDLKYLQFIPCLSSINEDNLLKITSAEYEYFLDHLFSLWYQDLINGNEVSIRYFDNLIGIILGFKPQSCDLYGTCSLNLVVESNGDIFPCDFYVLDQYKLGNINEESITAITKSKISKDFLTNSQMVNNKCQQCVFYQLCKGGCRRHRQSPIDDLIGENVFCDAYYNFFRKNIHKLEFLAMTLLNK